MSEDVLDQVNTWLHTMYLRPETEEMIRCVLVEVRELRKDKARLDFVLGHCLPIELWFNGDEMVTVESREEIDAAMEEEARTR